MSNAPGSHPIATCRFLRTKGMAIGAPAPDPTVPNGSDGFAWCFHSMTCLGPDGRVADAGACQPGRACHEG